MTVTVDPITLQLHFQRLQHATGFDVNALIAERDRYIIAAEQYHAVNEELRADLAAQRSKCVCWKTPA